MPRSPSRSTTSSGRSGGNGSMWAGTRWSVRTLVSDPARPSSSAAASRNAFGSTTGIVPAGPNTAAPFGRAARHSLLVHVPMRRPEPVAEQGANAPAIAEEHADGEHDVQDPDAD